MAAERQALSVDHLEFLNADDVSQIANGKTVAVMLPGAFYVLRETQLPPIEALRSLGVPMAVASDCNPGSSPVSSLLMSMNMACTLFNLTPFETLMGTTRNAAQALGVSHDTGTIEAGKDADITIWDIAEPAALSYHIGYNPCIASMSNGKWLKRPVEGALS